MELRDIEIIPTPAELPCRSRAAARPQGSHAGRSQAVKQRERQTATLFAARDPLSFRPDVAYLPCPRTTATEMGLVWRSDAEPDPIRAFAAAIGDRGSPVFSTTTLNWRRTTR